MWFPYQSDSRITTFYVSDSSFIQPGLISILILILIPDFNEFYDSDFNSNSIQKNLIVLLIPIPAPCDPDSNVNSHKAGFDSDSNSGIWFWLRYHLRLWSILNTGNFILYFIAMGASVWKSSLWKIITTRFFHFPNASTDIEMWLKTPWSKYFEFQMNF